MDDYAFGGHAYLVLLLFFKTGGPRGDVSVSEIDANVCGERGRGG